MSRELMFVTAYLLGSIPSAYIAVRLAGKGDVRKVGSGNVGATNTLRAAGWKVAVPVMLLDVGKGVLAVVLMKTVTADPAAWAFAGLAAIVGHCFPVWLGFTGGKGVATGCGVFATLAPVPTLIVAGIWIGMVVLFRFISLASLVAAASFPIVLYLMNAPSTPVVLAAGLGAAVIIFRHRGNIGRLVRGVEPKFGAGKKP